MPPSPPTPRWHRSRRTTTAIFSLLAALVSVVSAVSSIELATAPAAGATSWFRCTPATSRTRASCNGTVPTMPSPRRTSTAASQTINIQESTSPDGVDWTPLPGRDALPTVGAWAKPGDTWAPSVAFNGSEFVMYYSATEATAPGDQCVGVATSHTPLGPYTDNSSGPSFARTASTSHRPSAAATGGASSRTSSPTRPRAAHG